MKDFVHLHVHTEYSLLDGAARVHDLVKTAKEMGMPAIAMTDHGVMYGAVEFYNACVKEKIKPIMGCEIYVTGNRHEKSSGMKAPMYHLVLLAKNNQGYRNLMHIVSAAWLEGFYYKPRADKDLLREYSEGIIALGGCLKGEVSRAILNGETEHFKQAAEEYRDIFGEGNFYLEIQDHGIPEQKIVNEGLVALSQETGIPLVATNDLHYVKKEDAAAQDALMCIEMGGTLGDPNRLKLSTQEFYLKSATKMANLFPDQPQAIANTIKIANQCHVEIDLDQRLLPHFEVPDGYDTNTYLEKLCRDGIGLRYPEITPELTARLDLELKTITDSGLSGYFLIVHDFIRFAREQGIRVGPGRGSAAGSIVSYILRITDLDPIKYKLFFERFLNPERISLPDIDMDFEPARRDEVIEYVREKYGVDHVGLIGTFGTMKAKAAMRDAARVLDMPFAQADKLSKMVPDELDITLDDAWKKSPELRDICKNDPDSLAVFDIAKAIEGLKRHGSSHAAGVIISPEPLSNYAPLAVNKAGQVVVQFDKKSAEKIGLLKMDFLGLRNLTVIENTLKIIKRISGVDVDIDHVPLDDKPTFAMLRRGETCGVFQLESPGMTRLVRDLEPTRFEDIIATVAIFRPGPLKAGADKDICERKKGRQKITYAHPVLEPIFRETYGTMVYQEQVMQVTNEIAGFSLGEAMLLIKSISGKDEKMMAEKREEFIGGALANNIDKAVAEKLFKEIEYFAGYGFNKAHSAAYGYISYQTAYLKANYPVEYMAALMSSVSNNKDRFIPYINECRRMKIPVLPPDVNESFGAFTVVGPSIRFGLSVVQNIGENVVDAIIEARTAGNFISLDDFCARVNLKAINKRAVESLIKAGAFDFAGTRRDLLNRHEAAIDNGVKVQKDRDEGQTTLFGGSGENAGAAPGEAEPETRPQLPELDKEVMMSYEKEMLGVYVSDHPLNGYKKQLKAQATSTIAGMRTTNNNSGDSNYFADMKWIGGIVIAAQKRLTKDGKEWGIIQLEDLENSAEVIFWSKAYGEFKDLLVKDNLILVKGRIDTTGANRGNDDFEGPIKIIAMEAKLLDRRPTTNRPVTVFLDMARLSDELLASLKGILIAHPGPCPVTLKVVGKNTETVLELGQGFKVKSSGGLFAEVKALLGEKAIQG